MPHYETPDPISVVLELRVADVRVAAGERADTVVQVRPSDAARRDDVTAADHTRVEYADGRLLIKQPRRLREWSPSSDGGSSDGGSIDVELELPAGSDLSGHAAAGRFRCTGSLGRCEMKSSAGEIRVERAARAKLATAGDITLERVAGDVELTVATGDVRAGEIEGSAVVKSANGDTRIGEVGGELQVKAANGDIEIERSYGSISAKTANGHIRVGSISRGALVADTARGHIAVGIAGGAAAWLDLHTHFGHVHNGLDAAASPQAGEERVEVRARTGFGDITIRRVVPRGDELLSAGRTQ